MSGDLTWLIMSKSEVTGSFYENEDRQAIKSSSNKDSYPAKMYRRDVTVSDVEI